jgi:uncharacterized lipoprotein YajG
MRRTKFLALVVVCAALGSSGCALTEDTIPLTYPKQPRVPAIKDAERVNVRVTVADNRKDPTRVGCKKNGWGMEMAAIKSSTDVPNFVQRNVEWELKRRGFVPGPDGVVVEVALRRFYNDFKIGFFAGDAVAEVDMDVTAFKPGPTEVPVFVGHFEGEGKNPNIQLSSGENAKVALDAAFADAMKRLLADRRFLAALAGTAAPPPSAAPPTASAAPPSS